MINGVFLFDYNILKYIFMQLLNVFGLLGYMNSLCRLTYWFINSSISFITEVKKIDFTKVILNMLYSCKIKS